MSSSNDFNRRLASLEAELSQVKQIINCPAVVLLGSICSNDATRVKGQRDYPEEHSTVRFEAHNKSVLSAYQIGMTDDQNQGSCGW